MSDEKLKKKRDEVDEVDRELIDLLAKRLEVAHEIMGLKEKAGMEIRDRKREQEVIKEARRLARERSLDPEFAEDFMRVVISRTSKAEFESAGEFGMWAQIQKQFAGNPAQLRVARVLYRYGFRAREDGSIVCGGIRIPSVQIAREAGVDRRAVNSTIETIFENEDLREIFANLEPIPYLKGVARQLGLGTIEILPKDAAETGIISDVTGVISKFGLSIRQSIADDPYFEAQPKLTIITEEPVSGEVIEALRDLPSVESIIVY